MDTNWTVAAAAETTTAAVPAVGELGPVVVTAVLRCPPTQPLSTTPAPAEGNGDGDYDDEQLSGEAASDDYGYDGETEEAEEYDYAGGYGDDYDRPSYGYYQGSYYGPSYYDGYEAGPVFKSGSRRTDNGTAAVNGTALAGGEEEAATEAAAGEGSPLGLGLILALALGAVLAVGLIGLLVFVRCRRRRRARRPREEGGDEEGGPSGDGTEGRWSSSGDWDLDEDSARPPDDRSLSAPLAPS